MDKEDALDKLDFVAKQMVTRAEKRKKEEEEQAAAEQAANMARGKARAAKRVAIGSRLLRVQRAVDNTGRVYTFLSVSKPGLLKTFRW